MNGKAHNIHMVEIVASGLKALLSELGVRFGKTHNLKLLMDLLQDAGHALPPEVHLTHNVPGRHQRLFRAPTG